MNQTRQTPRGIIGLAFALLLGACATAPVVTPGAPAAGSTPLQRELALQTFDSAWSRINSSYYDPNFRGIDWPGVRDELRPRAEAATTIGELRQVLNEMLGRLGESHFAVIPREQVDPLDGASSRGPGATDADIGISLRWVEGELTVTDVEPDGAATAAGVRRGWIVQRIDDTEIDRWKSALARAESDVARHGLTVSSVLAAGNLLTGAEGSTVRIRFLDRAGAAIERDIARRPLRGEPVQFGNLPTMFAHLQHERRTTEGGSCIGIIRFNVWMVPLTAQFNRAVDELAACKGMVIDLRGNLGGVAGMLMGTAGAFMTEAVPLGVMRTRQGELRFVANPRRSGADGRPRQPFEGPLAVLIDDQSMSTSEVFAAGLQAVGRARVFGVTSPGYALPAMMLRLPTGDVLYHAFANLTDPNGRRIEGAGVVPDVLLPLRRSDLLDGRDRILETALSWIASR
jgi:carboxyl-terminal processing protease